MRPFSRFLKKGQVFQVDSIELARTDRLHHDYEFRASACPIVAKANDHFLLFSLLPKVPGLPRFDGRLDENKKPAGGKKLEIDVDLPNAPKKVRKAFKTNARYHGHHSQQSDADTWTFEVNIAVPIEPFPGLLGGVGKLVEK